MRALFALFIFLAGVSARAQSDEPVRLDIRLTAADLVDDLVFTWLKASPFHEKTPLIVAEIDAPIGLDLRFEQDLENHLFEDLHANPSLAVELVHCAACRQWIVSSEPKKTRFGRLLNEPAGQEMLRSYPQLHALSLHFEVIGQELVLWAEIYETAPPQRVVWARRYSQSTSARAILQDPAKLVGIEEARQEQNRLLEKREGFSTTTSFPIRTFTSSNPGPNGADAIPPLIFLQQTVESTFTPKRNRRAGLTFGFTSLKDTLQGWSIGLTYAELLFRDTPSLSQPDLYFRAGVTYLRLEGPGAALFQQNQIDVNQLINQKDDPHESMTAIQVGLEAHVKYRFGLFLFLEYTPVLDGSQVIATQHLIIPYQTLGFAGEFLW